MRAIVLRPMRKRCSSQSDRPGGRSTRRCRRPEHRGAAADGAPSRTRRPARAPRTAGRPAQRGWRRVNSRRRCAVGDPRRRRAELDQDLARCSPRPACRCAARRAGRSRTRGRSRNHLSPLSFDQCLLCGGFSGCHTESAGCRWLGAKPIQKRLFELFQPERKRIAVCSPFCIRRKARPRTGNDLQKFCQTCSSRMPSVSRLPSAVSKTSFTGKMWARGSACGSRLWRIAARKNAASNSDRSR